jgi:hypothetical protein
VLPVLSLVVLVVDLRRYAPAVVEFQQAEVIGVDVAALVRRAGYGTWGRLRGGRILSQVEIVFNLRRKTTVVATG